MTSCSLEPEGTVDGQEVRERGAARSSRAPTIPRLPTAGSLVPPSPPAISPAGQPGRRVSWPGTPRGEVLWGREQLVQEGLREGVALMVFPGQGTSHLGDALSGAG